MPFSLSELCVHEPKTSPLAIKFWGFFFVCFFFTFDLRTSCWLYLFLPAGCFLNHIQRSILVIPIKVQSLGKSP